VKTVNRAASEREEVVIAKAGERCIICEGSCLF